MVTLPKKFAIIFLPLILLFAEELSAACGTVAATSQPILVNKTVIAGTLDITVGEETLLLTYNLAPGWVFTGNGNEQSAWIGTNLNSLPMAKNGTPDFKSFPYHSGTSRQITIPLTRFGCEAQIFNILTHVAVAQLDANGKPLSGQTGWAGNLHGNTYSYFVVDLIPTPPESLQLPTIILTPENPAITRPASPS